jgi:hypothetical protein
MSRPAAAALRLMPGQLLVLFLVQVEQGPRACLTATPGQFLQGLAAACALLSFSAPLRNEMPPEELLPWAGNV